MRVVTGVKVVAAVAVVVAAAACSVPGEAVRPVDLSAKAAPAAAFPYGPGQAIGSAQVAGLLADLTFRPLRGENDPADCTPAPVDTDTAQVRVGPGGTAQGTLTAVVVRTAEPFDDFLGRLRRCPTFTLGGTVGTTVTTEVAAADAGAGTVEIERRITMGPPPATGGTPPPRTSVTEFVAQRGNLRVYVQNRRAGDGALGAEEMTATRGLFDAARASAFPAGS
ncbi:hypothetical protein [Gordonia sp. (in: high G+C Gram-positive bacteria)]|uniref:hypothetical protein n=1 Tax=Gordonia sp. (in: high G+C Gram-positive bacteria) TaxID=84139 RepID=UPI003C757D11